MRCTILMLSLAIIYASAAPYDIVVPEESLPEASLIEKSDTQEMTLMSADNWEADPDAVTPETSLAQEMSADDWEADPDHTAGDTRCQSTGSTNIYFQSNTASYDDCVTFAESKGSLYMSYRDGSVCQNDVCNDGGGKWNCNAADVCGVKTSTYLPWTVYTRKTCDANVAPENGDVGDCTS